MQLLINLVETSTGRFLLCLTLFQLLQLLPQPRAVPSLQRQLQEGFQADAGHEEHGEPQRCSCAGSPCTSQWGTDQSHQ